MKVTIGSQLPQIKLQNQYDESIDVNELAKSANLVLFFYPKDNTSGCIKEVCSFRDHFEEFKSQNTAVIGISGDSVASHKEFSERFKLSFSILSDEKNRIRKEMGVPKNLFFIPGRVTYIVKKGGEVIDIINTLTDPVLHIKKALESFK